MYRNVGLRGENREKTVHRVKGTELQRVTKTIKLCSCRNEGPVWSIHQTVLLSVRSVTAVTVTRTYRLQDRTVGQNCRSELQDRTAGQNCRAELKGRTAGQNCRTELQDRTAGQNCRTELQERTAGQNCRTELQVRTAGQNCRSV